MSKGILPIRAASGYLTQLRLYCAAVCAILAACLASVLPTGAATLGDRPNILWLTCEDTGPHLGCYGDDYATTPALDRLASKSLRYRRVWSVVPVCAPARTALITGRYPAGIAAEHMRSDIALASGVELFPTRLRAAGYYCVNNSKEDYNVRKPVGVWDESSPRAHWRHRAPEQPFFAVFNYTETHESATRRRPHRKVHDPEVAPVPPYMPSTREVREGWAQYYDQISEVDRRVAAALAELDAAGLSEDTIVFFFGDHGAGLPRHKRSACDSGLRVPFLIHVPPRWQHLAPEDYRAGGESMRLVSFVDLAPTVLSLAGVRPTSSLDGHAIAGPFAGRAPRYLFGGRGRMDERGDLVRSVTDGRYVYVRNYLRHLPHGQHVAYLFETPMTRSWFDEFEAGRLSPVQRAYWEPRAADELYDLAADPYETTNLARNPGLQGVIRRLRGALRKHLSAVADQGAIPEALREQAEAEPTRPLDSAQLRRAWAMADQASAMETPSINDVRRALDDPDPVQRYWGAMTIRIHAELRGQNHLQRRLKELLSVDPVRTVRIACAEALLAQDPEGESDDRNTALKALVSLADPRQVEYLVAVNALQALSGAGPLPREIRVALAELPRTDARPSGRMNDYLGRLMGPLLGQTPEPK